MAFLDLGRLSGPTGGDYLWIVVKVLFFSFEAETRFGGTVGLAVDRRCSWMLREGQCLFR